MATFYLIINQDRLYVLRDNAKQIEAEYFNGEPYYAYSPNRVKESVDDLIRILLDNNNLTVNDNISFNVVLSGDKSLNAAFEKALGGKIAQSIELDSALRNIMRRLNANPNNYIDEFGINYDGRGYKLREGELVMEDFSLLAYTINPTDILADL